MLVRDGHTNRRAEQGMALNVCGLEGIRVCLPNVSVQSNKYTAAAKDESQLSGQDVIRGRAAA